MFSVFLKRTLTIAVSCGVLVSCGAYSKPCLALTGTNVVFGVVSDVHLTDQSSYQEDNLRKALTKFKENNAKVIIVAGDLADAGQTGAYQKFNTIFNSVFSNESTRPQKVLVMGNHDYWNNLSAADAQKRFADTLEIGDINTSIVVNGYHFIGVSTEAGDVNGVFTAKSKTWLKQELDKAVADDPNKPIFVVFHQPVSNTVYGSDAWGNPALDEVLKNYPQVVTYSGHSHYVLEDERSIYQKDYTSVGTSTLYYTELETGKINGSVPPRSNEVAQGLIVKVNDNEVDMQRYDFHNVCQIKNDWVVDLPADKSKFIYTTDRANSSTAPYFPDGSRINISNISNGSCAITFDAAGDADFVQSYRIQAINTKTDQVKKQFLAFSDFYLGLQRMASTQIFNINGLDPSTEYEIRVSAIESYGKESQPLTATFTTASSSQMKDILNINFDKTGFQDTSAYNTAYESKGNASIAEDPVLNRNVLNFDGSSYVNYKINDDQLNEITNEFTLEAAFKLNTIKDQTVIENTEAAGIGFESTNEGLMELWVRIGSSYQRMGVRLETGKYYFLVGTYNGNQINLYLNGNLVKSADATGPVTQSNSVNMCLGGDPQPGGTVDTSTLLNGSIANIRIMNHGISASDVLNHYNAFINPEQNETEPSGNTTTSESTSIATQPETTSGSSTISTATISTTDSVSSDTISSSSNQAQDSTKNNDNPETSDGGILPAAILALAASGATYAANRGKRHKK